MTVFFSLEPEKNFNKIENNSYFIGKIKSVSYTHLTLPTKA